MKGVGQGEGHQQGPRQTVEGAPGLLSIPVIVCRSTLDTGEGPCGAAFRL